MHRSRAFSLAHKHPGVICLKYRINLLAWAHHRTWLTRQYSVVGRVLADPVTAKADPAISLDLGLLGKFTVYLTSFVE